MAIATAMTADKESEGKAKNEAIAAITASHKSSSAANAVKCSAGSTGITEVLSPSSGAASAS